MSSSPLRILIDDDLPGARNMAVDEAILGSVDAGISLPTLRFYRWSEPTVSLGYFQRYGEYTAQGEPVCSLPVVRRQTGGGAILHDDELTYSLTLPLHGNSRDIGTEALYRLVHDAFIETLTGFGLVLQYRGGQDDPFSQKGDFYCFARIHRLDLVSGTSKILGSAQRRLRHAVLQHGSFFLSRNFLQQPGTSLSEVMAPPLGPDRFIPGLIDRIADSLSLPVAPGNLSEHEKGQTAVLEGKYAGDEWTRLR